MYICTYDCLLAPQKKKETSKKSSIRNLQKANKATAS